MAAHLIRWLTPADAAPYRALWLNALEEYPASFLASAETARQRSVDDIAKGLAKRHCAGLFDEGGALQGFAAIAFTLDNPKLSHYAKFGAIYVSAAARGKGGGKALLQWLTDEARARNVMMLEIGANAENTNAVRLYERLGFTPFGLRPNALHIDGRYCDEILLSMHLTGKPA